MSDELWRKVIAGDEVGCLLLHGFSGSPLEMTPMAQALAEEGWTISVAQLAGHDTSPWDLARTTWNEWVASARDAYLDLRRRCRRIAIVGLSMGGAVALYLAASERPEAVVAISTPLKVRPLLVALSRAAARVLPLVPIVLRLGPREPAVRQYRSPYTRIPLAATGELLGLFEATRQVLSTLQMPLLVVQGRRDWVIPKASGQEIIALARAAPAQMLWLPHSGHVATLDRDRAMLFDEVKRFLRMHLADRGGEGMAPHGASD